MNQETFNTLTTDRFVRCKSTLSKKKLLYSPGEDRLSNFKSTGVMNEVTSQEALWGMVSKHIIATRDMVQSRNVPEEEWIAEYLGDIHNYLYLLEAIWTEART